MTLTRAARPLLERWALSVALTAGLAGGLGVAATVAVFPTALSRLDGFAATWLGGLWTFSLWLVPIAAIAAFLDARGALAPLFGFRAAPLHLAAPLLSCLAAGVAVDARALERAQVLRWELRALALLAALGVSWVALEAARIGLGKWRERHALPSATRHGAVAGLALISLASFACIHGILAPANLDSWVLPPALLCLASGLLAVRGALGSERRLPRASLPTLAIAWLGAFWAQGSSAHARFLLRGHCPMVTSLLAPLDAVFDVDGDASASRWIWGTDCDDLDASRGPLLLEIPADGVDQDCRGGDAPPPSRQPVAPVWTDCKRSPDPASVVLITIDALRADALSPVTTPEIWRFGQASAVFDRAYAPSTMTGATTLSMFGARAVSDLNRENVYTDSSIEGLDHFVSSYRRAGYHAFSLLPFELHPLLGEGFSRMLHARPRDLWPDTQKRLVAADFSNQLIEELSQTSGRYFAWVHYPDLHAPYVLREPGDESNLPGYTRAARYVDSHVGRVLRFLAASKRLANTLVIVTSDHGEQLGERGRQGHGSLLFEESVRVPLVLWVPGCAPRRVAHPVSLRHLAGTLKALTGVGLPGPTWFGETELPVVVEEPNAAWHGAKRAVISGRHKLIVDARLGGRMLFDLERDPLELDNLYGRDAQLTQSLERDYQRWLDAPGVR